MLQLSHFLKTLVLGLSILPLFSNLAYANDDIIQGFKSLGHEILIDSSVEGLKKKIFRYGNWYGPGYWGGSDDPNSPGSKGPVDSLDEVAMRHDFAYLLAEQQGAIYGKEEELRLKGIADKIAVDEAKALPADPRKWPNPPKGSVDYDDIKRYRERMIGGFTMEKEGYKAASTIAKLDRINNDKIGAILDVTDQKQKFNEDDIKRRVKTLTKNWKNVTDFDNATEDAKLTKEQKKELFQKFKENPAAFEKNYSDYKKKNYVEKSKAKIAQDKETAAIAKQYKVYPEDLLRFFNCVCRSSGGSLGGYYKPGKGGPCVATGPLSSWNTGMPSSKKAVLPCLNQIAADNYKKDQKIFDAMRQNDREIARQRQAKNESDYPKYQKLIADENAKSAQAEIKEIEELIGKGEYMEAAAIFTAIESLIKGYMVTKYYDGKAQGENLSYRLSVSIKSGLIDQAKEHAADLVMEKPLNTAVKKLAKACSINSGSSNGYCEQMQTKYIAWEQSWNKVISKEAPEVTNLLSKGKINSATDAFRLIENRINKGGLPPRHNDPIILALTAQMKEKRSEYQRAMQQLWKTIEQYRKETDYRSIVKTIVTTKEAWEVSQMTLESLNRLLAEALQNVRTAEDNDKAGDEYKRQKRFSNAVDRYQVSLRFQRDRSVQRKLDELLQRNKNKKKSVNASKKKAAGCRSDNDCPSGYVCEQGSGKCVSPFDGSYASFGKLSITRDEERKQNRLTQSSSAQNSAPKRGYSADEFDKDLANVQGSFSKYQSVPPANSAVAEAVNAAPTGSSPTNTPPPTTPTTAPPAAPTSPPISTSGAKTPPPAIPADQTKPSNTLPPAPVTPPAKKTLKPPVASPVFDSKVYSGRWNYSGRRPDGKKRSGVMTFIITGELRYTIVDEDGQSNGSGTGSWNIDNYGGKINASIVVNGKTWQGGLNGTINSFTFNSNHGTFLFQR